VNFFPLHKDLPTVLTYYKAVTCFTVYFPDPFTGGIVSVSDFHDAANKSKYDTKLGTVVLTAE